MQALSEIKYSFTSVISEKKREKEKEMKKVTLQLHL
jgi:hypothetical protein